MNNLKKILSVLLVLALAVSTVISITSCGGDKDPCTTHVDANSDKKCDNCEADMPAEDPDDGKATYTVTVKDDEGNAVVGAVVEIYLGGIVGIGEAETDANGKATFRLDEGNYSAAVVEVPAGYVFEEDTKVELKNGAVTLEVSKLLTYTVYVVDAAGNAVANASVQLCEDESCRMPKTTDATGKVEFTEAAGEYKAKVLSINGTEITDEYHYLVNGSVTIVIAQ